MRDRVGQLQEASDEQAGSFSTVALEDPPQQAAAPDPNLDAVLQAGERVRQEIHQLQLDVARLKVQNYRQLNEESSHAAVGKQNSNAIAADIKARAEAVLELLNAMNARSYDLAARRGHGDTAARIARTQYTCLSNCFREIVFDYNDAEMSHRESCKGQIQRQLEMAGRDVTRQEVEKMIESGQWNVFSMSAAVLGEVESRHRELLELESRVQGMQALFLDVAVLTDEHESVTDSIETTVQNTKEATVEAVAQLELANKYDKNNPLKKMLSGFCCCYK